MAETGKSVHIVKALQISVDANNTERPVLMIEADEGPIMVHMDRSVLQDFFQRAEPVRLGLLKTPEKFEEI